MFVQQLFSPMSFNQSFKANIDLRDKVLLDSQSTIDLYCNARMLTNIHTVPTPARLKSNGGTMLLTKQGTAGGYRQPVWYHPK